MDREKIRSYKTIVWLLGFILLFEVGMLVRAVPTKTSFIWLTLGAIAFLCIYLLVLCLRLIKEWQENSKHRD